MKFLKKFKFDKEEKELFELVENMDINLTEAKKSYKSNKTTYIKAATNTLNNLRKDTTITLRINSEKLRKLKIKAQNEGLPYQTYIGTLIHKNID